MPGSDWPCILQSVQSIVNQSALERLGNGNVSGSWPTTMRIFTGRRPDGLLVYPQPIAQLSKHPSILIARAYEVAKLSQLRVALEDMPREVAEGNVRRRTNAQKRHNELTKVIPVNNSIGDSVMACSTRGRQGKLASTCIGPMRIIASRSDLV